MTDQELIAHAAAMRSRAVAPYSHYQVGAALLGSNGKVYGGCNIEAAAYSVTLCAERAALACAVADGCTSFTRLAVIASGEGLCTPCGMCRQMLFEFAPELTVLCCYADQRSQAIPLAELLPFGFGGDRLPG